MKFNTEYEYHDNTKRARHGLPWTPHDYARLEEAGRRRWTLEAICDHMERSASGVIPKLVQLKLIRRDPRGEYEWTDSTPIETETEEETTMNPTINVVANITTQTLIRGRDAASMSDEQIFQLITKLERDVEALLAIKAKSVKLQAAVASLNQDIDALVAYVDGR